VHFQRPGPRHEIVRRLAVSHPRSGIGTYLRGSLAGLVEAAAGEHEIVAFAPTSPQGKRAIPAALEGVPVELSLRFLPFAHAWRQSWSRLGHPALERFLGPFDVLHFSDWMYPPQQAGVRATTIHDLVPLRFPEWVQGRTRSMHTAKYENAARTCDLLFANSEFTKRETVELLGVPEERVRVALLWLDTLHGRWAGDRDRTHRRRSSRVIGASARRSRCSTDLALAVGAEKWGSSRRSTVGIVRLG
jgi:glycosyltransferase involved in cell wall biosynthesis